MKRKIYDQLLHWKNKDKGSCALLIDGARRVGKSYIAREFAKEYKSSIFVDFSDMSQQMRQIFDEYLHDRDELFVQLQLYYHVSLHERNSLIVFDEVQEYPRRVPLSSIWSPMDVMTISRRARWFPSTRMSRTYSFPLRNDASKCIRWISRNSFGHWGMR